MQFLPKNVQFQCPHLTNQWKNYTGEMEGWASGGIANALSHTLIGKIEGS